jgi:bifunctional DNase/RNase
VFTDVIGRLGGHLRRVEVTELTDNTFHARLVLEQAGSEHDIDIRPSDAVALAVRTETPIFVAEAVLDQAGIIPTDVSQSGDEASPSEGQSPVDESKLTPFREFIETLDIDDLGGASGEKS